MAVHRLSITYDTEQDRVEIEAPEQEILRGYLLNKLRQMLDQIDAAKPVAEPGAHLIRPQFRPPAAVLKNISGARRTGS